MVAIKKRKLAKKLLFLQIISEFFMPWQIAF